MARKAVERPKVIDRLTGMKASQIINLWRNAVRAEAEGKKNKYFEQARMVIPAINREWEKRRYKKRPDDDFFQWPTTEASFGDGSINTSAWLNEGVLKYMGYQVGSTNGVATRVRQRILDNIFTGAIPPAFPEEHLLEWGDAKSAVRLQKMANTIAAFTRNAKRRGSSRMGQAIREWELDLEFLYMNYYVDRFHFAWPELS